MCVFVLCLCVIAGVCITASVCSDKRIHVSLIQHTSPMSLCKSECAFEHDFDEGKPVRNKSCTLSGRLKAKRCLVMDE